MGSLDHLRQQHRDLLVLAEEIVPLLQPERLANDFTAVRLKLSAFAHKLGVHIVLEDRFLHARLVRHSDSTIVAKAIGHQQAVHSLRDRVDRYTHKWITSGRPGDEAPAEFIDETRSIFDEMSKRLEREEGELYPLVDRICSPSGTWPRDLLVETDETRRAG
jgi:hypothetical protein